MDDQAETDRCVGMRSVDYSIAPRPCPFALPHRPVVLWMLVWVLAGLALLLGGVCFAATDDDAHSSSAPPPASAAAAGADPVPAEAQLVESQAATPPEAAEAAIEAPRIESAIVQYPSNASGTADVVLELLVEADGSVSSARALTGEEPFVEAALAASRQFRFSPATRAGRPVRARIRFQVRFLPPPPAVKPQPAAAITAIPSESTALSQQAASVSVIEVDALGDRVAGIRRIGSSEARVLPGAFGDPFRAISVLPGVAPLVTGLPFSYVRGAPPGNVGFFIDGVRVPLLYHAFLGPAVIHPAWVDDVELHAGGYPASFGRFAGGIVSANLAPPAERPQMEASIRLTDVGAHASSPFADGRGHMAIAGRYSYSGLLLSLLSDFRLEYWDYQLNVGYDLDDDKHLGVFAFGALDIVDPGESRDVTSPTAVLFHRVDLRYDQHIGEDTRLRVAATVGRDATRGAQGFVRDTLAGGRVELQSQLTDSVLLRAGANAQWDEYSLDIRAETENFVEVTTLFPSRTDSVVGGYVDAVWHLPAGVVVTPGLRVDHYRSGDARALALSPRLAATFAITKQLRFEHAFGLAHQPPNFVPSVPGVAVAGLPGGLQRSLQSSAGLSADLSEWTTFSVTGFQTATFGLSDPVGLSQDFELDLRESNRRPLGRSIGLELLLHRRMGDGLGGMLSYTLSRATRSYDQVSTLAGYDRTHVLNLALSKDLGAGWLLGARALFYSGVPGNRLVEDDRIFDQDRSRPFFRLDGRVEKRWFWQGGTWALVGELLNGTLAREVLRRPCQEACTDVSVGPIFLPSIGLSARY